MYFKILSHAAVLGVATPLFFSCAPLPGLGKGESASLAFYAVKNTSSSFSGGMDAFMGLVAPVIQQSKCNNCHSSQAPLIGSSTPATAYTAALNRLSISNPASSSLVVKSQDGHCSNCGSAPKALWVSVVEQWAEIERSNLPPTSTNPTGPITPPPVVAVDTVALPVFVTSPQRFMGNGGTDRSISLAPRGVDFAGVSFLYDLQDPYAELANAARISNVRIQNNSAKYIVVRGVRIFQSVDVVIDPSGNADYKADVGSTYTSVDIVIFPNSTTELSGRALDSLLSKSDGLYYAFGFQTLEATAAPY